MGSGLSPSAHPGKTDQRTTTPSFRGAAGEAGTHDTAGTGEAAEAPLRPESALAWVPGSRFARPGKSTWRIVRMKQAGEACHRSKAIRRDRRFSRSQKTAAPRNLVRRQTTGRSAPLAHPLVTAKSPRAARATARPLPSPISDLDGLARGATAPSRVASAEASHGAPHVRSLTRAGRPPAADLRDGGTPATRCDPRLALRNPAARARGAALRPPLPRCPAGGGAGAGWRRRPRPS